MAARASQVDDTSSSIEDALVLLLHFSYRNRSRMAWNLQQGQQREEKGVATMLSWAFVFLVLAIIAAVFGFSGIAGAAAHIAQILFFVFLILLVVSAIAGALRGKSTV
jgi:uncharacterized membrane protein YtjA (UPF0391 family)